MEKELVGPAPGASSASLTMSISSLQAETGYQTAPNHHPGASCTRWLKFCSATHPILEWDRQARVALDDDGATTMGAHIDIDRVSVHRGHARARYFHTMSSFDHPRLARRGSTSSVGDRIQISMHYSTPKRARYAGLSG